MRSSGGTNFGLAGSVVARTKSKIACFAAPSFQEGSASAALRQRRADQRCARERQNRQHRKEERRFMAPMNVSFMIASTVVTGGTPGTCPSCYASNYCGAILDAVSPGYPKSALLGYRFAVH